MSWGLPVKWTHSALVPVTLPSRSMLYSLMPFILFLHLCLLSFYFFCGTVQRIEFHYCIILLGMGYSGGLLWKRLWTKSFRTMRSIWWYFNMYCTYRIYLLSSSSFLFSMFLHIEVASVTLMVFYHICLFRLFDFMPGSRMCGALPPRLL